MSVRRWLPALLAVVMGVGMSETAFAQHCGSGGVNQLRGGPSMSANQLRGNPGAFNQLTGQLQAQEMLLQSQLAALQNQLAAVQGWNAAQNGYQNYARLYAAQQKRQAELRANR